MRGRLCRASTSFVSSDDRRALSVSGALSRHQTSLRKVEFLRGRRRVDERMRGGPLASRATSTRGYLSVSGKGIESHVRLLALHSFRTSAAIFKAQMRRAGWLLPEGEPPSRSPGENAVEVVFLDAPFEASGALPPRIAEFFPDGPYLEWWNASDDGKVYEGLGDTLTYVNDFVAREGPFQGVIGFSQGGTLAALLCAMQEGRGRLGTSAGASSSTTGSVQLTQKDFQCCICLCGLRSRVNEHQQLYESRIHLPNMHFLGKADALTAYSRRLVASFIDPIVVEHSRSHVVPPIAEGGGKEALRRFLIEHVSGPTPSL